MEMQAEKANEKEKAVGKIAVLADTATMRDMQGNTDWQFEWDQWERRLQDSGTTREPRFRPHQLRPHLLKILAVHFNRCKDPLPHGWLPPWAVS